MEVEIPFDALQTNDVIVVSAGQVIPVDGLITKGVASVDQHKLTGESQPVEKGIGDAVFASTIVLIGRICVQTDKTGRETVAAQIGEILNQTADFKNEIQSRGEMIADKMTMPTIALSLLTWPILGYGSAVAVLTNTLGFKMRFFAPASMLTFLNIASQQGILIKDGRSLDLLHQIDTVIFDKTGTLTLEQPYVGRIHTLEGIDEEELLRYAAATESGQTHPIAKAILGAAYEKKLTLPSIKDAAYKVGYGIQVELSDRTVHVGSHRFMRLEKVEIPPPLLDIQASCHEQGHSLVMVAFDRQIVGAIELHATIRPEAKRLVEQLYQRGMSTYIISGDQEQPTQMLAKRLGVDCYFANTLPEHKAAHIERLQNAGRSVCFVGDGINDSIALKKANVSISLRGATTIATDTAQVVLMDGTLNQLNQLFHLSQHFQENMKRNLLIATLPSMVCLGGIFFLHWGVTIGALISPGVLFVGLANATSPLYSGKGLTDSLEEKG